MTRKQVSLVAIALAFWPIYCWFVERTIDRSDEGWGVLAMITLGYFILTRRNQANFYISWGTLLTLLIYIASFHFLPPLGHAIVFAFLLCASIRFHGLGFHPAVSALLILSLPILPTVQFVFGYPLRVAIGTISCVLLKVIGFNVVRSGALLEYGRKAVFIDAPCSGIRMLWMGSYLVACICLANSVSRRNSYLLFVTSFCLMFFANVIRSIYLFSLEISLPQGAKAFHEPLGLLLFLGTSVVIGALATWMKQQSITSASREGLASTSSTRYSLAFILSLLAFLVPFCRATAQAQGSVRHLSWRTTFQGFSLSEVALSEREQLFLRDFPGEIKRFSSDKFDFLVRYVEVPTRKLHPSADCLKGAGYSISPAAPERDTDGFLWTCSIAKKNDETIKVCEMITNGNEHWTDVSSWYWSAIWKSSPGPWWAYTKSERVRDGSF